MEALILCIAVALIAGIAVAMTAGREETSQIAGPKDKPLPSGTDQRKDNEPFGLNVGNR